MEGMGYAIPISQVSDIIENLMNQTTRTQVDATEQGYLGISGESVTEAIAAMYGIASGCFYFDVTSDGLLPMPGLNPVSILTSFDGTLGYISRRTAEKTASVLPCRRNGGGDTSGSGSRRV